MESLGLIVLLIVEFELELDYFENGVVMVNQSKVSYPYEI